MVTTKQASSIARKMLDDINLNCSRPRIREVASLVKVWFDDAPPEWDAERWCDVRFIPLHDTDFYQRNGTWYVHCLQWLNENYYRWWDKEKECWQS